MDGEVDMHYRENGEEHIVRLKSGDIFYAGIGTEHVAHPCGEARILVIEKEGSVGGRLKKKTIQVVGRILVSDMKKKIVQRVGFENPTYGWKIRQN